MWKASGIGATSAMTSRNKRARAISESNSPESEAVHPTSTRLMAVATPQQKFQFIASVALLVAWTVYLIYVAIFG